MSADDLVWELTDKGRALAENDRDWRQEFARVVREREALHDEVEALQVEARDLRDQAVEDAQHIARLKEKLEHAAVLVGAATRAVAEADARLGADR